MKTFGKICVVLAMVAGLMTFNSCKKDKNALSNTRWETTQSYYTASFNFMSSTSFTYEKKTPNLGQIIRLDGTYTFDGTNISLTFTGLSGEGYPDYLTVEYANANQMRKATVNGNQLTYSGDVYDKK